MREEYPFPFLNEAGKLHCQLCGEPFLIIAPAHLIKKHKVTYSEYKLRFPDAPLTTEGFHNLGKYGKEKNLFVKEELEKLEEEPIIQEFDDDDIPEHDVYPTIEENIDFQQAIEENLQNNSVKKANDICGRSKDKILEHLQTFFTNIKKDHMIQIKEEITGRVIFEYISDFSDPILKINIEFPRTFWHNKMSYDDPNRNRKLREHGWKVIEIKTQVPTFKDISNAIKSL